MSEEPELPPTKQRPVIWLFLWITFVILPGASCPVLAKLSPTQNSINIILVIAISSFFGLAFATGMIQQSDKGGCAIMLLGTVMMVMSFFIGCASQL